MQTLVVANSKGGVGKTSLAVNLAVGLAGQGKRTLLVDLDPQGNATAWLLGLSDESGRGIGEALLERRFIAEHVRQVPDRPGLTISPATPGLTAAEAALLSATAGEAVLVKLLERQAGAYDFAVLDTPPHPGKLTGSAIVAADGILVPFLSAFFSLAGIRSLDQTVAAAQEYLHARARVLGYVQFAADGREGVTEEAADIVERERPGLLFKSAIRVSTAAKTSPARRRTAFDPGEDARGIEDYQALLREVLARLARKAGR